MSERNPHMRWVAGYKERKEGRMSNTWVAYYSLNDLMQKGYLDRREGQEFLKASGLTDFHWEITWNEKEEIPATYMIDRIADVQGYVLWVHGWTGNMFIWEDMPSMVVSANPELVSIAIDHNGFGGSLFEDITPSLDSCNPPAAMRTLQKFVDLLRIRRQAGQTRTKVINFVGHSMGAATLFYLNPLSWNYGELTRIALAPALLLEDENHRLFYQTLGLGIGILQHLPVLEIFERFIKPSVLHTLTAGSTQEVKAIHSKQYNATPRGITGATFMAMGRLKDYEIAHDFDLMQVILGHRDPLVGLVQMMDLLGNLEFPAKNIHVVPGTHYMFSVGNESVTNAYNHAQTREMVINDVLESHQKALAMQKKGRLIG